MIVIAAIVFGALYGAYIARSRKGTALDIAQYAAGFGIAFGVLGLFLTLAISEVT